MAPKWRLVLFETEAGNCPVAAALEDLDPAAKGHVINRFDMLETHGLALGTQHVRGITGKSPLREFRLSHNRREFRLLFFPAGDGLIAVHFFQKKGSRAERELAIGHRRMVEWIRRGKR